MEIRKYYFTEWQEELKRLDEEAKRIVMTEEQKEEESVMQKRLQNLYACIEKERSHFKRILDLRKQEFFEEMSQKAVSWAEGVAADLYAGIITQFCGKIEFRTNMILLNEEAPSAYRSYFIKLFETADDISIYIEGNVYVMVFYYKLYTEVKI